MYTSSFSFSPTSERRQAARNKRRYGKACDACLACRRKQPLDRQATCDASCGECALGTTMPVVGGGGGGGGSLIGGGAPYAMNFETGVGTVSCYDISNTGGSGKCGSAMAYANTLPGIDFDAAIPLAYWPPGAGFYGNCADCGVRCSGPWGPSSVVAYDGAPLCYQITSHTTGVAKTIRVNDACGERRTMGGWLHCVCLPSMCRVNVMNFNSSFVKPSTQAATAPRRKSSALWDTCAYRPYIKFLCLINQPLSPPSPHVQQPGRVRQERGQRPVLAFLRPHHRGRIAIVRLRSLGWVVQLCDIYHLICSLSVCHPHVCNETVVLTNNRPFPFDARSDLLHRAAPDPDEPRLLWN